MAVTYGFYNSLDSDRQYNALQMSSIFDGLISDGVFMSIGTSMMVTATTGMVVSVGIGRAWFDHTWTLNDAVLLLTVEAAESILHRIDTVVLEVDSSTEVRENSIKIIAGTPSSTPVAATLSDTEDLNQYPLAYIAVAAGATEIVTANITNKVGTDDCPFVTSIIESIDVDTLLVQWEAEFDLWFDEMKDQLTTDAAGNLQDQIDDVEDEIDVIDTTIANLVATQVARPSSIINGLLSEWQRGNSIAVAHYGTGYTADRWDTYTAGGAVTISRQAAGLAGSAYCLRCSRNLNETVEGTLNLGSSLETKDSVPLQGKDVTFSFLVRKGANYSGVSDSLAYHVRTGTGTDESIMTGAYTGQAQPITGTVIMTSSWQKVTATGTVATSATEIGVLFIGTGTGTAGAADYFEIAQVKLEPGAEATPLIARPYGGELALCQRYCQKSYNQGVSPGTGTPSGEIRYVASSVAGEASPSIIYPVTMRTTPTRTIYSPSNGAAGNKYNYSTGGNVAMTDFNTVGDRSFSGGSGHVAGQLYGFHYVLTADL